MPSSCGKPADDNATVRERIIALKNRIPAAVPGEDKGTTVSLTPDQSACDEKGNCLVLTDFHIVHLQRSCLRSKVCNAVLLTGFPVHF